MVARLQVIYALAHFDDGPGRLMADRHGHWSGRLPLITERSEWQRPAAATLTSTSPGPGGSSSSVSTVSALSPHTDTRRPCCAKRRILSAFVCPFLVLRRPGDALAPHRTS